MDFNFSYHFRPNIPFNEKACWFIFRKEKILLRTCGDITEPLIAPAADIPGFNPTDALHVGVLDGLHAYAFLDESENGIALAGTEWVSLRWGYGKFDDDMFYIYGRAHHLLLWSRNNRFCGRCGNPMALKADERCFLCPACGYTSYPRISPAVIVSVEKDGKLLLARGTRFQMNIYSVLAGFVEPGESLEDCIRREIKEEVGIDVKNISYFKSQPWPFPDSLMIAFTAEYAGGVLKPEPSEIEEAGWYGPDDFPPLPRKFSVARALIDHFVEKQNYLLD